MAHDRAQNGVHGRGYLGHAVQQAVKGQQQIAPGQQTQGQGHNGRENLLHGNVAGPESAKSVDSSGIMVDSSGMGTPPFVLAGAFAPQMTAGPYGNAYSARAAFC